MNVLIPAAFASRGPTNEDLAPFKKGPHSPLSFEEFVLVLSMAKSEEVKPIQGCHPHRERNRLRRESQNGA